MRSFRDVVSTLPEEFQSDEPPSVIYSVSSTIRKKLFNYKGTVSDIDINDLLTYGTNLRSCDCQSCPLVDKDLGHIVTGDLRIVENQHLRKLISK